MGQTMLQARLTATANLISIFGLFWIFLTHLGPLFNTFHPFYHPVRFIFLLTAIVLNAKNLPLVWHFRVAWHTLNHYAYQPKALGPDDLFKPIVTKGVGSPLPECDYNLHKSNSTYFSDADMARTMLTTSLLRKGMKEGIAFPDGPAKDVKGRYSIALGAVSCQFKREIAPHQRFDIWTRILAYDKKWLYLCSHFVRAGTVQPTGWLQQPWKKAKKGSKKAGSEEEWKKAVFATSVAKYVVKKGRLTIPPAECLEMSGLLPGSRASGSAGKWDMEKIEARRQAGLQYAEKFGALDGLFEEWPTMFGRSADGTSAQEDSAHIFDVIGEFGDFP